MTSSYATGRKTHQSVDSTTIWGLIAETPQGMTLHDIALICEIHYTTALRKVQGLEHQKRVYVSHTIRTGERGTEAVVYKAVIPNNG